MQGFGRELGLELGGREDMRRSMREIRSRVARAERARLSREFTETMARYEEEAIAHEAYMLQAEQERRQSEQEREYMRDSGIIASWTRNHGIPTFQYFGGGTAKIFEHAMFLYVCREVGCQCVGYRTFPYCDRHYKIKHHVEIRKSTIVGAGDGLFALQSISTGHRLPYTGELKSKSAIDDRYGDEDNTAPYAMQLGDTNQYIDSALQRCTAAWTNHSERSNCKLDWDSESGNAFLEVVRDVLQGDELFADYGSDYNFQASKSRIIFIQEIVDQEEIVDLDEEIVDLNED